MELQFPENGGLQHHGTCGKRCCGLDTRRFRGSGIRIVVRGYGDCM